jgi:hypothetical protein
MEKFIAVQVADEGEVVINRDAIKLADRYTAHDGDSLGGLVNARIMLLDGQEFYTLNPYDEVRYALMV